MNVLATKREARTARRCSRMSRRTGKRRSSRSTAPVRAAARAGVDTRCSRRSTRWFGPERLRTCEDLHRRLWRGGVAVRGQSRAARGRRGVGVRPRPGARRRDQRRRASPDRGGGRGRACPRDRRSRRGAKVRLRNRRDEGDAHRSAATAAAFAEGAVASVQNGVGNEEAIARHVGRVIRGTTFPAGRSWLPVSCSGT